jgi:hypothetical protein
VTAPGEAPADRPAGDSAGVAWAGRTLTSQPFDGDDGEPDPALAAALDRHPPGAAVDEALAARVAAARLLVPVVAVLARQTGAGDVRVEGDKRADMAMVTLTGTDGGRALPVFSGLVSLHRWDGTARPVPVEAARAALAAVAEGCDVLVLDPAGPQPVVIPRPVVWAMAQGRTWRAPARDPQVVDAVARAIDAAEQGQVARVRCEPGEGADLVVVLGVRPGLGEDELAGVLAAVRDRLGAQEVLAERVSGVRLRVHAA